MHLRGFFVSTIINKSSKQELNFGTNNEQQTAFPRQIISGIPINFRNKYRQIIKSYLNPQLLFHRKIYKSGILQFGLNFCKKKAKNFAFMKNALLLAASS